MPESAKARRAWADYLALGEARSLEALLDRYRTAPNDAPTCRLATLKDWSRAFEWQRRLLDLAGQSAAATEAEVVDRRRAVLETGLALDHERIALLKDMAQRLHAELTTGDRLWVKEPRGVAGTVVEVEKFNGAEVEQFRGLLSDIAKERKDGDHEERIRRLEEAAERLAPVAPFARRAS